MNKEAGVVIIVDDDPADRQSLEALLASAGIATRSHESGKSLFKAGLPAEPACALLELRLSGEDGLRVQKALRAIDSALPIIFLSGEPDVASVVTALKGGAIDFLEKGNFRPEDLLRRVRAALQDHRLHLDRQKRQQDLRKRILTLSGREHEVALLVARGKANKTIAQELDISERTVEIHRGNAMRKLRLRSVTALARLLDELNVTQQDLPHIASKTSRM